MASSSCIGIQFDKQAFSNDVACFKWLRTSQWKYLENLRGFKLKTRSNSTWMSSEKRSVFAWDQDLWQCKHIVVERPTAHVLIISRGSNDYFARSEVPALSDRAQRAAREAERKQEIKDQDRLERKFKLQLKRKRARSTNKGSSASLTKEIERLDKKFVAKEQKMAETAKKRKAKAKSSKKAKTEEDLFGSDELHGAPSIEDGEGFMTTPPLIPVSDLLEPPLP